MDPTEPIVDPGRLGHYLLLAPLGEGGVGQVHAAVRAGTQQLVVLKQLRVELSESVAAQERLRREAEILGLLDHPGIARLFDAGYADDRLFLVLEHITGTTLAKLAAAHLEDGRLVPYAVSCTLACDFLEALAHAHRLAGPDGAPLGLVHRDLSPRNLLMDRSGRGRLIDFGVARAVMGRMETVPGAVVGTPRYLAPEQARGEQVGQRADLYTLGVVLYELLTAQRVTPRADRAAVMQAVLHHTPPPLHTVNPRLPRGLSDVLSTALDKDPGARFEDAEQFLAALLDAAGELARAPRDRLHLYFDECFPEVRSAVEGLEARARQEGPRAAVPGVTFALFARAQAEAWVPTRTGGPGPAEPSHPPSRAGGPLRAPLATGGPGPAESGSAEPEAWHEPTRTDVTHAPEHATQITPPRSRPGQVEGLEVPAHARPTVPMAFFPGDPAAPGPVETREVPAHARPTVPMASFTADPLTLVARAEPPERGAGPRVSPRSPPPDPALVPRRRRRRSL
ncbi:MAG: protein kinase, partial [Myxococcales bacterium]|nr:protein kinase [Myxococcales bacterium]